MKRNKTKVYGSKTYPMTDTDRERLVKDIQAERIKHDRDMKCDGIAPSCWIEKGVIMR